MKSAICCVGQRPILDSKSVRSLDLIYLREWLLLKIGGEIDFIGPKIRESKNLDYVVPIEEVGEYDRIFVYASQPNFFGGKTSADTVQTAQWLASTASDITHVVVDPAIPAVNFGQILFDRDMEADGHALTQTEAEDYGIAHSGIDCLFAGRNYSEWQKSQNDFQKKLPQSDLTRFEDFFAFSTWQRWAEFTDYLEEVEEFEYDISYYGSKRGGYRTRRLKQFLEGTNCLMIGAEYPWLPTANCFKKVQNPCLPEMLQKAMCSLIVGDEEHNQYWDTVRVYELPMWGIISTIDEAFDPDYRIYPDIPECYVSGKAQLDYVLSRLTREPEFHDRILFAQRAHTFGHCKRVLNDLKDAQRALTQ